MAVLCLFGRLEVVAAGCVVATWDVVGVFRQGAVDYWNLGGRAVAAALEGHEDLLAWVGAVVGLLVGVAWDREGAGVLVVFEAQRGACLDRGVHAAATELEGQVGRGVALV